MYNGETIVRNVSFLCEEATDSPYGNYLITLPKEVRSKVAESLGIPTRMVIMWVMKAAAISTSARVLSRIGLFYTNIVNSETTDGEPEKLPFSWLFL